MAFTTWDLGGCNCGVTPFTVYQCTPNGSLFPAVGVTVSVYSAPGGTLLDSGVTNASGVVSLAVPTSSSGYVTVTGQNSRLQSYAATVSWGLGASIQLVAAAGYACLNGCGLPTTTTLNMSRTLVGGGTYAGTLTYSSNNGYWSGVQAPENYDWILYNTSILRPSGSTTDSNVTSTSCPPSLSLGFTWLGDNSQITITE